MSTTFGDLKTRVATNLQDPNARTFSDLMIEELIYSGLIEVGRIAPEVYTEDLTPVTDQSRYVLRSAAFSADPQQEIEVSRVEVWDLSDTAEVFIARVPDASVQPSRGQDSGWSVWNGTLTLPSRTVAGLTGHEADYVIRVWGYSPYVPPVDDVDVINVTKSVEQAMLWFIRVEALDMLLANRDLFTQWQTRSGNTDMTPAGLMNQRNIAESMWRTRSRSIARLRAEV